MEKEEDKDRDRDVRKTRTRHLSDDCELKMAPRMRVVKSKRTEVTTSNSNCLTICETSGKMKICINLMPLLVAAREPVEEEEGNREEKDIGWTSEEKSETSIQSGPSVNQLVEQKLDLSDSDTGLNLETNAKQPQSPRFVLPTISQCKLTPGHCQKTMWCHTVQPAISSSEQTRNIFSNVMTKHCRDHGLVKEPPDERLWIDNPLSSKSVSKPQRQLDNLFFAIIK